MKMIPVLGDFQQYSRALHHTHTPVVLVTFGGYPKDFSSLASLNERIGDWCARQKETPVHLPTTKGQRHVLL